MSLAFVRGIHRWSVNSPHKGPVTWKKFHLLTLSCFVKQEYFHLSDYVHFLWDALHTWGEYWHLFWHSMPVKKYKMISSKYITWIHGELEIWYKINYHWKRNHVILTKFSSLVSLEVVIWQLPVQPVMRILLKWHFHHSDYVHFLWDVLYTEEYRHLFWLSVAAQ